MLALQTINLPGYPPLQLHLPEKSITAVIAPSNVNKSQLLQTIAEQENQVTTSDYYATPPPFAYVMPNRALLSNHTALSNVTLPLIYHRLCSRKAAETKARTLLDQLGFRGNVFALPSALIESEQRIVALARGLMTDPEVLLLDEAFANIDALEKATLATLYRQLLDTPSLNSIMLSTLDVHCARLCADQFIFLSQNAMTVFDSWTAMRHSDDQAVQHYMRTADHVSHNSNSGL